MSRPNRFASLIGVALLAAAAPAVAQFSQQGPKLAPVPCCDGYYTGYSVSLSADGNTALVGAFGGGARAWVRSGGVWAQQGPPLFGLGVGEQTLEGASVSLSADGNTALVGAPYDNGQVGAALVWTRSGDTWTQQGPKLVGSGAVGITGAQQGYSVSLSADGNTAIIGAPWDGNDGAPTKAIGAAWVWTRSGGVWTQQGSKLVGSGGVLNQFQGASVSLSADGNTAAVGGHFDDVGAGAVWVWTRSAGMWTQQGPKLVGSGAVGPLGRGYQGSAVSLSADGNTVLVGGSCGPESCPFGESMIGAAWVWTRSGGAWTQQGPKLVGSDRVSLSRQGASVSLSADGNTAIIGGPGDGGLDYFNAGAAWVWRRSGGIWNQQGSKLVGSGAAGEAAQGSSVSLSASGQTAIVGGPFDKPFNTGNPGAAWVFETNNISVPVVVTSAATGITQLGATLNGTVNPQGSSTSALFHYGPTTSYGSQVPGSPAPGSGASPVAVSATIAGLNCGTLYHFRAAATNPGGTITGEDVTFTTGVCPTLTLAPNSGAQGQANLNVVITGAFTHFVQGTTAANLGTGIVVNSTTVQSATQATANVTITLGATLGARTVTVVTSGEVVTRVSGFTVTPMAATLTGVSPNAGRRGVATPLLVLLTGQATHFVQGTSIASFGTGVTVNSTTVQSATQATANITIAAGAALGARTVTVTTGGEVVAAVSVFLVTPASVTRGDFDGDGRADVAVFRPSTGAWYVRGVSTTTWGGGDDIPVAGDYDGDGKNDVGIFRPSTGVWFILLSGSATGSVTLWGGGGDIPAPGDYDGDGRTDIAVFRPSTGVWYVLQSSTATGSVTTWGGGADMPAARDYDGDGKTDIAVFRPSTSTWYILRSSTATGSVATWGGGADIPVSADYDGDGKVDVAVFRPSTGAWFILRSSTATGSVTTWGGGGDVPVPGDFDGDGKTDVAVFRPSTGDWFIINSSTGGGAVVTWGGGGDIPVLKRP